MYMYINLEDIQSTSHPTKCLSCSWRVTSKVKLDRSSSLDKMIRELNPKTQSGAPVYEYRSRVGYTVPALELG